MPLEKASAVCQASKLLAAQCRRELAQLRKSYVESEAYNEAARIYLQSARWTPPSQCEESRPAQHSSWPVVRSDDAGWSKRAQETRFFAEKTTDANVRRELMAIAELYDLLGAAEPASAPPAIDRTSSDIGAIAA